MALLFLYVDGFHFHCGKGEMTQSRCVFAAGEEGYNRFLGAAVKIHDEQNIFTLCAFPQCGHDIAVAAFDQGDAAVFFQQIIFIKSGRFF